jgi:hypothetical protein
MPIQDIYGAIIGRPPTDEEKLKALAGKLRGRSLTGQLGMLTGDRVLNPLGEKVFGATENQAEQIGRFQARQRELEGQAEMARMNDIANAREAARRRGWEGEQRGLDRALDLEIEGMRAAREAAREAKQDQKDKDRDDKALAVGTRMLSHDLQKINIPAMERAFSALDATLKPYMSDKGGIKEDTDLPGAGLTGTVFPGVLTPEGKRVRQDIDKLRNEALRMASGLTVTDQESARKLQEIGRYLGGTDEEIMYGLQEMRNVMENVKRNAYAGYDDSVVAEYESRMSSRRAGASGDWGTQTPLGTGGSAATTAAAAPVIDPNLGYRNEEQWKAAKGRK